jgi:glycosyltransferase involved in cell wall biosynthesis
MRLLLIQSCHLPGAGSTITAQVLLEGLAKRHDISYITLRRADLVMLGQLSTKIVRAQTFAGASISTGSIRLVRHVRDFNPDIIYGFGVTCNLVACAVACLVGAKTISSYRGMPAVVRKTKKLFIPLINRSSDAVIAISEAIKSQLVTSFGTHPSKIHVVPPPIEYPLYETFPLRQPEKLFFVGRLHQDKGVDLLIRAMKHLPERFQLQIVGDGPERQSLENLAEALSLTQRVSFGGYKESVISLLHENAGMLIVPSRTEGLGRVILEAFAAGVPVVATDTGGIGEIVSDRESGYLISSPPNPESIANAILRAAGEQQEWGSIINRGLEVLARYSKSQVIEQTEVVMRSLFSTNNNAKSKQE